MTNERESYLLKVINSLLNLIVVLMLLVVILVGWFFVHGEGITTPGL